MGSQCRKVAPRGTVTKVVLARFVRLPVVRSADRMDNTVQEQQTVRVLP